MEWCSSFNIFLFVWAQHTCWIVFLLCARLSALPLLHFRWAFCGAARWVKIWIVECIFRLTKFFFFFFPVDEGVRASVKWADNLSPTLSQWRRKKKNANPPSWDFFLFSSESRSCFVSSEVKRKKILKSSTAKTTTTHLQNCSKVAFYVRPCVVRAARAN